MRIIVPTVTTKKVGKIFPCLCIAVQRKGLIIVNSPRININVPKYFSMYRKLNLSSSFFESPLSPAINQYNLNFGTIIPIVTNESPIISITKLSVKMCLIVSIFFVLSILCPRLIAANVCVCDVAGLRSSGLSRETNRCFFKNTKILLVARP